ncbi:unnamed protein product [Ambrosiozyma monospora]|uniref:Unnamed protein product n=1 Tax=Ambrosiozyma monospora TaxID=43982 RepID=A0ACB5SW14_AMBMO|nr:unnamed protein product [Ambrosiozyma monospora]
MQQQLPYLTQSHSHNHNHTHSHGNGHDHNHFHPPITTTSSNSNSSPSSNTQSRSQSRINSSQASTTTANSNNSNSLSQPPIDFRRPIPLGSASATNSRNSSIPDLIPDPNSTLSTSPQKKPKQPKICKACGEPIIGTLVRAMGNMYHVDCFTCYDCGKPCSSKFFAADIQDTTSGELIQVPLCEYNYFKRIDLICVTCDTAIRGSYITAAGKKYHPEHFYCEICHKVFDSEDYYEYHDQIYCHYHYSKLYASHCEACKSAILKQYVEMVRGGREQQWHPECFMVHKFWGVDVTIDHIGFKSMNLKMTFGDLDKLKEVDESFIPQNELFEIENKLERTTMSVWLTISEFEESCASCISDMLHFASSGDRLNGLLTTGRLVLKVETLFKGLDLLTEYANQLHIEVDYENNAKLTQLTKEPRSMSSKIMSYLTFLRDTDPQKILSSQYSRNLLSLISTLAHYIKLISRNTLIHALEYNRLTQTTVALDKYLTELSTHDSIPKDVFPHLGIAQNAKDTCFKCGESIEEACFAFFSTNVNTNNNPNSGSQPTQSTKKYRWHLKCLDCSECGKLLNMQNLGEVAFDPRQKLVLCNSCGSGNPEAQLGFVRVSKNLQLIYLLKIALVRSRYAMRKRGLIDGNRHSRHQNALNNNNGVGSRSAGDAEGGGADEGEDQYARKVADVKRLRSQRQTQKIGSAASNEARISVIVEAPVASSAGTEEVGDSDGDLDTLNGSNYNSTHAGAGANGNAARGSNDINRQQQQQQNLYDQQNAQLKRQLSTPHPLSRSQSQANGSGSSRLNPLHHNNSHSNGHHNQQHYRRTIDATKFLKKEKSLGRKGSKRLRIEDAPMHSKPQNTNLDVTSTLLKNEKSLTLDDIPRIVSSEQAREHRPNAFRFQKRHYQTTTATLPTPKSVMNKSTDPANAKGGVGAAAGGQAGKGAGAGGKGVGAAAGGSILPNTVPMPKSKDESMINDPGSGAVAVTRGGSGAVKGGLRIRYSELNTVQHDHLRYVAAFALHKLMNDTMTLDDCLSFVQIQKKSGGSGSGGGFWDKLFGSSSGNGSGGSGGSGDQANSVFGAPLHLLVAKYGVDSDLGIGDRKLRIPMFIDEIINVMHNQDLSAEGVFRLNGNIRKLKQMIELCDSNPNKLPDFGKENCIQNAALMKRFFRDMPDPLLTFRLYDLFILSQKLDNAGSTSATSEEQDQAQARKRDRILKLAYCMLPKPNRDLTEVLLSFLTWVSTFCHIDEETGSKMDIHNLATVLTPNILYEKPVSDIKKIPVNSAELAPRGENHFLGIECVNCMIECQEDLSFVPEDLFECFKLAGFDKLGSGDDDDGGNGSGGHGKKKGDGKKKKGGNGGDVNVKEIVGKCKIVLEKKPGLFDDF